MFRADLLPHKEYVSKFNYDRMASPNIGLIYLFIFDNDGMIKEVFSHEIIYD